MMKDLLKMIQTLFPPRGAPMWMLDLGAPELSTTTIFEVVGKVEFVPTSQSIARPNRTAESAKQNSPVKVPDHGKTP